MQNTEKTKDATYANELLKKQTVWWKRLLDVQAPYRWHLKWLQLGYILDIGCGVGRNLIHLKGNGVGVDHNLQAIKIAKNLGLNAFTNEEFIGSGFDIVNKYDSLLLAHVAEHMTKNEAIDLLKKYVGFLKPKGRLVIITPQERGYKSDLTHIEFIDFQKSRDISKGLGFNFIKEYSFPFPSYVGRFFTYNEFISISQKPE
jgi:SAM-dependent methyltransferase